MPENRPPIRRRLALIGGLLVLILLGVYLWQHFRSRQLILVGVVDANEYVVTPPVQARIDSLWIDEGSTVQAGQRIGVLEQSELAAQAASSAASAASMRAQLQQSQANALQTQGETQSGIAAAQAQLASAQANLSSAEAQLTQVRADASRDAALLKSGAIAPADLEQANTTVNVQQAAVNAARQQVQAARDALDRAEAQQHANAAAQKAVVTLQARVSGAEADSAAAETRLGYVTLRAPVSGVVQVLSARLGELVGPGAPVAVIVDQTHPWVRVSVPETEAGAVAVGDSLPVELPYGQTVRGEVISKTAEGEFATQHDVSANRRDIRAVALRIAISNSNGAVVPGMTAQVTIPTNGPPRTRATTNASAGSIANANAATNTHQAP